MAEIFQQSTIQSRVNQPFGRNIVWRLPVAYIEADLQGILTFVNEAACELHQLPAEELVGNSFYSFLPSDEIAQSKFDFQQAILSGEDPPVTRRSIFSLSGSFRTKELHRRLLRDEQQTIVGICCAIFDVNEAESFDHELKLQNVWLESLLEAIPNPIIATDSLGFVRYANLAAQKITGRSLSQIADSPLERSLLLETANSETQLPLSFRKALEALHSGKVKVVNRDSSDLMMEFTASPIFDGETGAATGVVVVLNTPAQTT